MVTRLIHQLWVGPKPMPQRESDWCAQMARMNPTWRHKLHGNELLERYASDPYVKHLVGKGEKWAFITDRLRILLLRDEGGIYVDADAEPVRPFDTLPIWDWPHVDFVAGLRSPARKAVALHRGIPVVDNTFLASAKGGRMISRINALWTPEQVTGEKHAINGHRTGVAILEAAGYDTVLLGHHYIYCEQRYPESLIMHDSHNLASWVDENTHQPRICA